MEHIETIELTSSQSSITFSSIPQDYDDLIIVMSNRNNASVPARNLYISINSSTANFSTLSFYGRNGSVASDTQNRVIMRDPSTAGTTANTFSNTQVYLSNYTSSNDKSISVDGVGENNGANDAWQQITSLIWSNTSAITSISFDYDGNGSFLTGSTMSLYGVTAGGDGTVTTS